MTELRLPESSRAATLLARVDGAYIEFVSRLPPSLRDLAGQKTTFTGTSSTGPFKGPSSMNPGITCTPWLLWTITQAAEDELFLQLALGGSLIVLASVILDHLVDGQVAQPAKMALLHQALFEGGMARFRARMPPECGFWRQLERLGREHIAGLAAELETRSDPDQLTFDGFVALVPGKFSPIVITMAAFVAVLGKDEQLAPIETSIKHLAVASQLLDDMGDWQDDLGARRLTYYLSRLAPREVWHADDWPTVGELQQRIDAAWLDVAHMRMVQEWLDRAGAVARDLACPRWMAYLDGYRVLAAEHLTRYKARHALQIVRPIVKAAEA